MQPPPAPYARRRNCRRGATAKIVPLKFRGGSRPSPSPCDSWELQGFGVVPQTAIPMTRKLHNHKAIIDECLTKQGTTKWMRSYSYEDFDACKCTKPSSAYHAPTCSRSCRECCSDVDRRRDDKTWTRGRRLLRWKSCANV